MRSRYAPSGDLLAMLTKGGSLSPPANTSGFDSSGGEARYSGASVVDSRRAGLLQDNPNATFKMSDFPALDGRASLSMNGIARDTSPLDSSSTFLNLQEETNQQPKEADSVSRPIIGSQTASFAMQSEDFPALPGSQLHHPSALFNDSDGVEANSMPCFNPDNLDSTGLLKGGQSVLGMKSPPAEPVESRHLRAAHLDDHGAELSTFNESNATDLGSSTIQMHHHHGTIEIQGGKAIQTPLNHGQSLCPRTFANKLYNTDELVKGTRPDAADLASMRFTLSKSVAAQQQTNSRILQESGDGAEKQTKFGLLGLLDVIRMTNADLNTLALGSDLTTLGLNLNSAECLYSTFASPWAEAPTMREPQFSLPMCYYMQPPPLKTSHLSKFQLETLFYIFYAMPKDVLQAYSAQELYNRDWQYHQDLKLWFKRGSTTDGLSTTTNQYIYFDINSWECRLFSSPHVGKNIASGLLREDDVRVKFATSS